jgi:hypothetical protein
LPWAPHFSAFFAFAARQARAAAAFFANDFFGAFHGIKKREN